jgi:hypothetical protein
LEDLLKQVYGLQSCSLDRYFHDVQIQHVPKYSYGEEIAVLREQEQKTADWEEPESIPKWPPPRLVDRAVPIATWITGALLALLIVSVPFIRHLPLWSHKALGAIASLISGLFVLSLSYRVGLTMKAFPARTVSTIVKLATSLAVALAVFFLWMSPISPIRVDEGSQTYEAARNAEQTAKKVADELSNVSRNLDDSLQRHQFLEEQLKSMDKTLQKLGSQTDEALSRARRADEFLQKDPKYLEKKN